MHEHERLSLSDYEETIREVLDSGGEFTIYPGGASMLPLIAEGRDSVSLVKPENGVNTGDIALYRRKNGQYVLHRVIGMKNGCYTMCGDNQLAPEKGITDRDIIGIVGRIRRKGRDIPADSFFYGVYCFLWRSFFVRRVYFKLRKIFGRSGNRND